MFDHPAAGILLMALFSLGFPAHAEDSPQKTVESNFEDNVSFEPQSADNGESQERQRAKAYFKQGTDLFQKGEYEDAAKSFQKANSIQPHWRILFNMAQSEAAAKKYGLALEAFEACLNIGGDDIDKERLAEIVKEMDLLRERTGILQIKGQSGSKIYIDGIDRGELPLPGKLAVSSSNVHTLEIKRGKKTIYKKSIKLMAREELEIDAADNQKIGNIDARKETDSRVKRNSSPQNNRLSDGETPAPATKKVHSANKSSNGIHPSFRDRMLDTKKKRIIAFSALGAIGAGTLGIVGSFIAGELAKQRNDEIEELCDGDIPNCDTTARIDRKWDKVQSASHVATALFITGTTVAVAGSVLLIILGKKTKKESLGVQIQPSIGGTVGIQGRF